MGGIIQSLKSLVFRSSVFLLIFLNIGCGKGIEALSDVCDGYSDPVSSPYRLPWSTGTSRVIGQGNCSSSDHYSSSRFAYDIGMEIGTAVLAARSGVVVELKESFSDGNGCPNANYVYIQHSDGTVGQYSSLTKDGVVVNLGDNVVQGQPIGSSGNTGCSPGPHLHFQVVQSVSSGETIPVTFSNVSGNPKVLKAGSSYSPQ